MKLLLLVLMSYYDLKSQLDNYHMLLPLSKVEKLFIHIDQTQLRYADDESSIAIHFFLLLLISYSPNFSFFMS
jgi:hypothetical protein